MEEGGNEENNNTQQDNTGNMYSYRNDSQNIKESGAIRRSMGDVNPSNEQYYNNKFGSNNNNNNNYMNNNNNNYIINNNNNIDQYNLSENSSRINQNPNLFWLPYIILAGLEGAILLALALLFEYQYEIHQINRTVEDDPSFYREFNDDTYFNYGQFRDVNIMAFIGFGLVHSILKRNAWASITINTLLIAFSVQIALFFNFVWKMAFNERWRDDNLDFYIITKAIFVSCSISITFGCVLGKLSTIQYIIMAIFEVVLASMNMQLLEEKLEVVDTGGSLYIHTFGGIFALAVSVVLFCSTKAKDKIRRFENLNTSNYFSNIITFIGVLFIFVFMPSFNSILSDEAPNINRARVNTFLSLLGSVIGSVVTSGILNQGKIVLEQILYGVLSGGIIISGCCSVCYHQWAAMILGTLSSAIMVSILAFVKPIFIDWGLRDCCNVIITHGIFGLLGGFITPMFISHLNIDKVKELDLYIDEDRGNAKQAGIQVGGLFITLGISFVGGIATGFLMKVSTCGEINWLFNDAEFFNVFDEEMNLKLQEDEPRGSQPSYN